MRVRRVVACLALAPFLLVGCFGAETPSAEAPSADPVTVETTPAEPIVLPTDGTWDMGDYTNVAGFGQWSPRDEPLAPRFAFKNDTPPTLTQDGTSVTIESRVQVYRNEAKTDFSGALDEIYAYLKPGVSIMDDDGVGLRYDEAYGEADIVCDDSEIEVGEETTCTLSFTERSNPDWLQDSHWNFNNTSVAIWPSQTHG